MQENFEEMEYEDSTTTKFSDILPKSGKRFRFEYEYDFGDSWQHEVLFEGCVRAERGKQYPVCLEGARACPPEDVGGVWGYADFWRPWPTPNTSTTTSFWSGPAGLSIPKPSTRRRRPRRCGGDSRTGGRNGGCSKP